MEKSEMMKRYEAETGKSARDELYSGSIKLYMPTPTNDYIAWLETKAEAYDRLMSGGKKTPQEIANFLDRIIAMDADHKWHAFGAIPFGKTDFRWITVHGSSRYRVPCFHIKFDGDWKDSLTLPDGWDGREGE